MYSALSDILQTFSARAPMLWALLTLAAVAVTSLGLYLAWEWISAGIHAGRVLSRMFRDR